MIDAALPFFIAPLLLTWFAPSWRWLLAFVVLSLGAVWLWLAALPNPPPGEESQGEFLLSGFLLVQAAAIASGAAIGVIGRGLALILRKRGVSFGWRAGVQVAPLIVAITLAVGIPAWQDRSPSSQCRSALFDVMLDGEPYRLPTAPIFSATALVGSKYHTWIFRERPQLNQFCSYVASRQPLALKDFGVTFAVLHESELETYSTKPVDGGNEARRERLCSFGALTRTACAASTTEDAPRHASIKVGVDERCDCTFGHLVYALTNIIRPDLRSYPAYGEGVRRSRRETAMGAFTRFDITDTDADAGWTRTNSYFRANPTLIALDARGNPIVFDCGAWLEADRETVRCHTTYPIGPRTYLSYEFDVAPAEIVARAPRIDANMRAVLADMRTPN